MSLEKQYLAFFHEREDNTCTALQVYGLQSEMHVKSMKEKKLGNAQLSLHGQ